MEASLRFTLRKDLINKRGEMPISLIIALNGQKRKISTGISIIPELWSEAARNIMPLTLKQRNQLEKTHGDLVPPKAVLIKYESELNELKFKIQKIEEEFRFSGVPYSASKIVDSYKESNEEKVEKPEPEGLVYDFIDQYIQDNELIRAKGSLVVYKSLRKHLKNFQKKSRKKIRFENMDYIFMQAFQNYLVGWKEVNNKTGRVTTLNNVSIGKQLSTLKTFLSYARRRGIKVHDGYKEFTIKKERLEVIALNQREFDALYNLDLGKHKRLQQVKDIFIFSCATGYRYSDLRQLRREHIKGDEIRLTITKTKEPSVVPLNRYSREILAKYEERVEPLPIISNQKFNNYVKELCKLAGIDEPVEIIRYRGAKRDAKVFPKYELISAHTGRKTFVTLSLAKGIPAEVVMKITGHSDYKSFKRYIEVDEQRKRDEMTKAWS
ncbi:site-specific integrase [Echinicola vietnamensis]|uniref:Site-specific recombinase XerD n=1 Tax=Echinicola vietnamensis (strain DSM 17526 / LMG 23754 / KMM 6221) TaxID=926556 RepID=L0FTS7_ECHVK|nr:site-specific integrase [Echinicola vietnamensis]AGA76702.1 site-specific recombinase XerD [Echinicola vietnamensis DSM 17526]